MIKEIDNKVSEKLSTRYPTSFFQAYDDGRVEPNDEYEDDGCIHIQRGRFRYSFIGKMRDIDRFAKGVDKARKELGEKK